MAATGFSRAKIYRWIKQGKLIWEPVKRRGGDRWRLKLTCVGKPNSDRIPTWRRFNRACDRQGLDPGRVLAAILRGAITEAIDGDYVFVDVDKVAVGVRLVLADSGELSSALQGVQPAAPCESFPAWLGEKLRPPEGITLAPGDVRQLGRKEPAQFRIAVSVVCPVGTFSHSLASFGMHIGGVSKRFKQVGLPGNASALGAMHRI